VKVKVVKKHPPGEDWGWERFPVFAKGAQVAMDEKEGGQFPGWHACEIEGRKTYAPKIFVEGGRLARDYDPTELEQEPGDILEVREIAHGWLLATNEKGATGWIPAHAVASAG
jgi:hypothetical protein